MKNNKYVYFIIVIISLVVLYITYTTKSSKTDITENEITTSENIDASNCLVHLKETNLRIVALTSIAKDSLKDEALNKIANSIIVEHNKIGRELNKIAEKNLIILPDTIYDINIKMVLKYINSDDRNDIEYLNLLSSLTKNQIENFEDILQTTDDDEIKTFLSESIKSLQNNLLDIKALIVLN